VSSATSSAHRVTANRALEASLRSASGVTSTMTLDFPPVPCVAPIPFAAGAGTLSPAPAVGAGDVAAGGVDPFSSVNVYDPRTGWPSAAAVRYSIV